MLISWDYPCKRCQFMVLSHTDTYLHCNSNMDLFDFHSVVIYCRDFIFYFYNLFNHIFINKTQGF
jgi:hypothetical protein